MEWPKIDLTVLASVTLDSVVDALLLLVVCLIVIRIVLTLTDKMLSRSRMEENIKTYFRKGLRILSYVVALLIVADSLGVPVTSLLALFSVLSLAISLAVQDILADVAAGIVIALSKPFKPGDYVEAGGRAGTVVELGISYTKLDTPDGQRILLPNSSLSTHEIVNYTMLGKRRINHLLRLSLEHPPRQVRAALLEAVARTAHVRQDLLIEAVLTGYPAGVAEYAVRCWCDNAHYWTAYSALLENVREVLAEQGISLTGDHLRVQVIQP